VSQRQEGPTTAPGGLVPGAGYRWLRRLVQSAALLAVIFAPLLGGWQRVNRADMAVWDAGGFDLWLELRSELPVGETAATAHEMNLLKGGGIAHEYFGIAAMDPLAGALALMGGSFDSRAYLAWLLPIALALIAGRAFCGWLCPFGTLSRWLDAALSLLPFHHRIALPRQRLLRFVLVLAAAVAGVLGFHMLLYLLLPYLLLQHAVYAGWLLGGLSAALSLLAGLLVAGVFFGPTTYCATLCPTGAALSLFGRLRWLKLTLSEPKSCGRSCSLCSRACWLQLAPAGGDPGPDCDLCARCVTACPRTNLVISGRAPRRRLPVVATAAVLGLASTAKVAEADADTKPRLLVDAEERHGRTTVAVSVMDLSGVELVDLTGEGRGVELGVYLARERAELGSSESEEPGREVYKGPLALEVVHGGQGVKLDFDGANSPRSTQGKAIYQRKIDLVLAPGDSVRVMPVAGWLDAGARFEVAPSGTGSGFLSGFGYFVAGFFFFGGLLSLSLISPGRGRG